MTHMQKCVLVPAVKNINLKVFNLMSRTNETRYIKLHENFKWKCRLDASVCDNKQHWDNDKSRCECKELIGKGSLIKDLFGILVIMKVIVINHKILESI